MLALIIQKMQSQAQDPKETHIQIAHDYKYLSNANIRIKFDNYNKIETFFSDFFKKASEGASQAIMNSTEIHPTLIFREKFQQETSPRDSWVTK